MPPILSPVTYEPIKASYVFGNQGSTPAMLRTPEGATQTFQLGVPTQLVGGFVQEWTTMGVTTIYGVSAQKAANYTVAGVPVDLNDPAAGPPPNQPAAIVIPMGAALRDGNTGVYVANGATVFTIALKLGQVFTQALLIPGTLYGLTKDATTGFWYLDTTVTGGNSAAAVLLGVDSSCPNDATYGSRVFFQFAASRRFVQ